MKHFILLLVLAGSAFGQSMVLNQTNLYERMRTGVRVVTNVPPVTAVSDAGRSNSWSEIRFGEVWSYEVVNCHCWTLDQSGTSFNMSFGMPWPIEAGAWRVGVSSTIVTAELNPENTNEVALAFSGINPVMSAPYTLRTPEIGSLYQWDGLDTYMDDAHLVYNGTRIVTNMTRYPLPSMPYVTSNGVSTAHLRMVFSNGVNRLFIYVGN